MTTTFAKTVKKNEKNIELKVRYTDIAHRVRVENFKFDKCVDCYFVSAETAEGQCLTLLGEGWKVVE